MLPFLALVGLIWIVNKSIERETVLGDNMVGFSFGKIFKKGNIKSLAKLDWKNIKKTAKTIGPAVATVYPPAGAAIYGGLALEKALKKGDKKAIANVALTAAAARGGNPRARLAMNILSAARNVRGQKQGLQILNKARGGDIGAINKIAKISAAAGAGDYGSAVAMDRLENASAGKGFYHFLMTRKKLKSYYRRGK